MVSLFAISLLALTGIGYATFTSAVTINGTASAGNINLYYYSFSGAASSSPSGYGTCSWSGNTGTSVSLSYSNMVPGDSCAQTVNVEDTGTLPILSLKSTISGSPPFCQPASTTNCITVTDTLGLNTYTSTPATASTGSTTGAPLIPASGAGSYAYTVTIAYPSGSTSQSFSGTFTITLTGSIGT